jgi:predicted metalloprotease with PDZ domain
LTPERALLYGQAALARPVWAEAREVAVEIWAPPRWSVATSWPQVALDPAPPDDPQAPRRVWRFWAEDLGHLEDSFVAGGTNLRLDARPMDDGRLLLVATQGPLPLSHDALMEAAARFLVVQRRYVPQGWAWPAGTRQVSVLALGHEGDLLEGAGRRGGVVLELGAKAKRADTLELVAHELFHTLNGHLLVHSAYAERDTLWFKEGVTSYVAAVSVVRAGYEEEGWFLERVGAWASDLRGNPWQGQPAAKLHEAQGRQDAAALRLPYDRGALVGLLLDAALWDEATGQGGLERLMGWLLSSFAARGASYDEPALREGVVALLGEAEGGRLWEAHLSGTSPLPLDEILGRLGLGLREATVPAPYFGLVLGEDQRGWFVVHVEPRSPAAKAGLGVGDRLAGQPNLPTQRIASAHLEVIHPSGTWTAVLDPEPGQRAVSRVAPTSGGGAVWRRLIGR